MTNDPNNPLSGSGSFSDDLSEYLQVFIDESVEELDSLVEAILALETDPRNSEAIHKAFRMLHSLKGSCGMMGFERVGQLAHELEDRFEKYRSDREVIDPNTATLVLNCIDFFREFVERLRRGDAAEGDPTSLLERLSRLNAREAAVSSPNRGGTGIEKAVLQPIPAAMTMSGGIRIEIKFKPGLQLSDLKARLIVSKLSAVGEVLACDPPIDDMRSVDELPLFSLTLLTDRTIADIRKIANVDGVESIEIQGTPQSLPEAFLSKPGVSAPVGGESAKRPSKAEVQASAVESLSVESSSEQSPAGDSPAKEPSAKESSGKEFQGVAAVSNPESAEQKSQINETLRIDIDRLDRLMNLTGELVVANARFARITGEMSPIFRRNSVFNRSKDLTERLRRRFQLIRRQIDESPDDRTVWNQIFDGLDDELEVLDEQSSLWDEGHHHFSEIAEAVDQLTRVSKNLQRGVLNTRMVPVGPLFNRFKRVIRDFSAERGKRIQLSILGEKTELDKRMIDALGDPLLHLVRNAVDHGLESSEQRIAAGKSEVGSLTLEASHRGNNVLIRLQDDGGGINLDKIRQRVLSRGLASESQIQEMNDQQVIDYIWHPGFSTAEKVTDISGRGIGMDIVRNAIAELSGTIDVATTPGAGTEFTIRLPLTLAIMHSLLIRFRDGYFSLPIDDVREIVSVPQDKVYAVHRHQTIDVRGELIPLFTMDDLFEWNPPYSSHDENRRTAPQRSLNVVILHSRGKTLGLCVDTLVGRADIVIKSLSENFVQIRGLSGASIMGDGAVCLMLDSMILFELASERVLAPASGK